jgi:Cdc6-like AAA superfamily ATPase
MRRILRLLLRRVQNWRVASDVGDAADPSSPGDPQPQIPLDLPGGAGYNPDAPLDDPDHDRFRRWPFAQRIAHTIAELDDPSSLVIGIYGSWGEGKTTVFNFLKRELSGEDNVICFRFNPWRYPSEDVLLHDFFNRLAEELDRSLTTWRSRIGTGVAAAGMLVPTISISLPGSKPGGEGPGLDIDVGEAIRNLGTRLSTSNVEATKSLVGNILRQTGTRVVVLMDDIDRLEDSKFNPCFELLSLPQISRIQSMYSRLILIWSRVSFTPDIPVLELRRDMAT